MSFLRYLAGARAATTIIYEPPRHSDPDRVSVLILNFMPTYCILCTGTAGAPLILSSPPPSSCRVRYYYTVVVPVVQVDITTTPGTTRL